MAASWPEWVCTRSQFSELVRFISPSAAVELGLIPPETGPAGSADERAAELYESLRARHVRYSQQPGLGAARADAEPAARKIRPPVEAARGPATRLDVALVFAAMALHSGLRTLLLLDEGTPDQPLVVIDLRWTPEKTARVPPGFVESPQEVGVFVYGPDPTPPDRLTSKRGWLVIDPACATTMVRPAGTSFADASGDSVLAEAARADSPGSCEWYLLDIDSIRRANVPDESLVHSNATSLARIAKPPHEPPRGLALPVIFSHLPPFPDFVEYPTRTEFVEDVEKVTRPGGLPAVVVLHGPPGVGKSMIAQYVAATADFGYGWILNAADAPTLRKSLARAQATELAELADLDDPEAVRALASEALRRLNGSDAPWVVVLENCDRAPDSPGLRNLMPTPHRNGQFLITTTAANDSSPGFEGRRWVDYARQEGWQYFRVPELDHTDLEALAIPDALRPLVGGRPLIAQVVAAVQAQHPGVALPAQAVSGPNLAWELVASALIEEPTALELARVVAWCPAEPVPITALETLTGRVLAPQPLADLWFLNLTEAGGLRAVQMHRLFSEAVRSQTWRDDPTVARATVKGLLTQPAGRKLFVDAADSTTLLLLQHKDTAQAAEQMAKDTRGLLWRGLASIWDQRGPVSSSKAPFELAYELLDPAEHPYEYAETAIGLARVAYQSAGRAPAAAETVEEKSSSAQAVLAGHTDQESRLLIERAKALLLLMERRELRKLAREARQAGLLQIIEKLWQSYEQRVRIACGLPDGAPVERQAPAAEMGSDVDRAYFNLAGAYVSLSQTYPAGSDELAECLGSAGRIYTECRLLREERYGGRAHPHLAACIHGQAIVAYYQGLRLPQPGRAADAIRLASTALTQRQEVASGLAGGDEEATLGDGDVRKSTTLLAKAAYLTLLLGYGNPIDGDHAVNDAFEEAREEFRNSYLSFGKSGLPGE